MRGKPVTYGRFFPYPQSLWIRLWNTGVQASPRLAGPARRTGWRYFRQFQFCHVIQTHDCSSEMKKTRSRPRRPGSEDPIAAVHNERCGRLLSRGFRHLAGCFCALAEPCEAGFAHSRGMPGRADFQGRANRAAGNARRRSGVRLPGGDPGAPADPHRQSPAAPAFRARGHAATPSPPRAPTHPFGFDDVRDHAPVRLIRTAKTHPKPTRTV